MKFPKLTKKFISSISCLLLLISVLLGGYYTLSNTYWSDGDEFHYIVMSESFVNDKDFNLENEFEEKNYLSHHGREEGPHGYFTKFGDLRSHHNILLPILIAPGYIARGLLGARIIVFVICLISLYAVLRYQEKLKFSKNLSKITTALFVIQMPIIVYSQYAYTDLISGYFVLWGSLFILSYLNSKKPFHLLLASTIFGLTSFLHIKIIQYAGLILGFFFIWHITKGLKYFKLKKIFKNRKNWINGVYTFAPWILLNLLFAYTMYRWYGEFNPAAAHNLAIANQDKYTTFYTYNPVIILKNFFGLFIGGESGLLPNAPLFALLFPGLWIWFKKDRRSFFIFALPTILFFIRQTMFVKWRTWGPPARYLMVMLPIMIPSIAYSLKYLSKKIIGKIIIAIISIISFVFYILLFKLMRGGYPSWTNYNTYWQSIFVKIPGGESLSQLTFIDLINPNSNDIIKIIISVIIMVILSWYIIKIFKKEEAIG